LLLFKKTYGLRLLRHEVQLVFTPSQVLQGGLHGTHTLFSPILPVEQVVTQSLFWRFNVLQAVQLEVETEQVKQSPVHGWAIPEISTYPSGAVTRQLLFKNTNVASQVRHVDVEEQLLQLILKVEQAMHWPNTESL